MFTDHGYVGWGIRIHAGKALLSQRQGWEEKRGELQPGVVLSPCLHVLVQDSKESKNHTFILGLRALGRQLPSFHRKSGITSFRKKLGKQNMLYL